MKRVKFHREAEWEPPRTRHQRGHLTLRCLDRTCQTLTRNKNEIKTLYCSRWVLLRHANTRTIYVSGQMAVSL